MIIDFDNRAEFKDERTVSVVAGGVDAIEERSAA